jgi:D-beta-D-heptose 7-phosphate kinase / D-beta-D-heptose 1-phosphate adenosyltransferase
MASRKTRRAAAPKFPTDGLTLPHLRPLRVLVVGEVILDRYLWGDVARISPEAPIPILRVQRREEKPGNAGFVMANLCALGAEASAVSIVGKDRNGAMLRDILGGLGIRTRALLSDPDRPTIVKERMLGSVQAAHRATQQLLRVDEEDPSPITPARERELLARFRQELTGADGVLISDINKGLLTPTLVRAVIDGARRKRIPVVVDPRLTDDFSIYRGANAITPNRFETEQATGMKLTDRDAWRQAAELLVRKLGLDACLITLDRDGMYLAERGGADTYVATVPRDVYDVTGAGDVVLSVFGLLAIAGLHYAAAAQIANLAASLEVSRLGTEVISREDLAQALKPEHTSYERKIVPLEELTAALDHERQAGRRIAFTNGCFDLLHAGHVQSLNFSRAQADRLVVGLNSDRSVRALKGPNRPIYPAAERARILAALECVDYVVIFEETRAEKIIRAVKPDVLVKGEDWRGKTVDGQEFVESRGGRVALAPLLAGRSTSAILRRLGGA